jgi:hypothetical protein
MTSERLPSRLATTRNLLCLAAWSVLLVCPHSRVAAEDDALAAQQRRIREMPPAAKRELWELQQRFYRLDAEERQRLKDLHTSIAAEPNSERLREVMTRYTEWLKTLSAGERADLLSLPAEQRIDQIRTLMNRQATSHMRFLVNEKLSDEDLTAITQWMKEIVKRREAEILQNMPMLYRGMIGTQNPEKRVEILIRLLQRFGPRPEMLRPTQEDIERLKTQLSPAARTRLEEAQQEGRLAELAESWMRAAIFGRRLGPPVDKAELERFYREDLDPKEREYLESMPRERMQTRLILMYYAHREGRDFGQRPGGPGPPGPGPPGMGGGFRGRGPRPWPPDSKPDFNDPRRKPRSGMRPGDESNRRSPDAAG